MEGNGKTYGAKGVNTALLKCKIPYACFYNTVETSRTAHAIIRHHIYLF